MKGARRQRPWPGRRRLPRRRRRAWLDGLPRPAPFTDIPGPWPLRPWTAARPRHRGVRRQRPRPDRRGGQGRGGRIRGFLGGRRPTTGGGHTGSSTVPGNPGGSLAIDVNDRGDIVSPLRAASSISSISGVGPGRRHRPQPTAFADGQSTIRTDSYQRPDAPQDASRTYRRPPWPSCPVRRLHRASGRSTSRHRQIQPIGRCRALFVPRRCPHAPSEVGRQPGARPLPGAANLGSWAQSGTDRDCSSPRHPSARRSAGGAKRNTSELTTAGTHRALAGHPTHGDTSSDSRRCRKPAFSDGRISIRRQRSGLDNHESTSVTHSPSSTRRSWPAVIRMCHGSK